MLAIESLDPQRLILSGGDTAIHVLDRLGIERLDVIAEQMPGMPLCRGRDRGGRLREVVLKAGNHGHAQTLLQLFAMKL
ncbi:MAG: hypothetical protein HC802_00195 [Caldilineaceae bacterium]|nr:hypothetical protein [Caldilineaceae bacterium]